MGLALSRFSSFKINTIFLTVSLLIISPVLLSVLDQMPIDHTSAQKLVKMGYPNLEGHTYEEALDIAEQRDIYQMLQEHDSSINLDDISAVEYDNLIDSIKDGMSVQDATKQLAEALAERYVPPVRRRGGR
ncbi:MAG: hypothetical protein MSA91_09565 [Lachnobacterium sp.]|nr:hypothetical protein [Lachnobacterium sp.]MDY2910698.1 hypothetical protein [Agathobacter sp.]